MAAPVEFLRLPAAGHLQDHRLPLFGIRVQLSFQKLHLAEKLLRLPAVPGQMLAKTEPAHGVGHQTDIEAVVAICL